MNSMSLNTASPNNAAKIAAIDTTKAALLEAFELIGLTDIDLKALPAVNAARRKVRAGQSLCDQGERFEHIFVVRIGTFKTTTIDSDGAEQVLGFALRGDILGCDAYASGRYSSYAIALEDSEVIAIPLEQFKTAGEARHRLERHLFRSLSQELNREHRVLAMIGTLGADARVAHFLATLSERYSRMGYSSKRFVLRMTRQEIANHLGLTMETVSRAFSHLSQAELISANQRSIEVNNVERLRDSRSLRPNSRSRACSAAASSKRAGVAAAMIPQASAA